MTFYFVHIHLILSQQIEDNKKYPTNIDLNIVEHIRLLSVENILEYQWSTIVRLKSYSADTEDRDVDNKLPTLFNMCFLILPQG